MNAKRTGKRSRLIEAAAGLIHRRGFHQTSLAAIAEDADIALGNVYYYFKTKDAIGEALVDQYAQLQQAQWADLGNLPDPRRRLEAFIDMTVGNRDVLAESGCPIGTLNAELHKHGGELAQHASKLFAGMLTWLQEQFKALGHGRQAPDLALHLLSALQGVSLLAHSFHNPDYVVREAKRLKAWINSL